MTIKINAKTGSYIGAHSHTDVLAALAQQMAHDKADAVTAPGGTTGGTTSETGVGAVGAFSNVANDGGNLATKATVETRLGTLRNSLALTAAALNSIAAAIGGFTALTDSTGGTAGTDYAALADDVAGAATGSQATELNAIRLVVNQNFYNLAVRANALAKACGVAGVNLSGFSHVPSTTLAAVATASGTAASPGVTAVAVNAALEEWSDNLEALKGVITRLTTGDRKVLVV